LIEIVSKIHEEVATKQDLKYLERNIKSDLIIKLGGMMIFGFIISVTIILTVLPILIGK